MLFRSDKITPIINPTTPDTSLLSTCNSTNHNLAIVNEIIKIDTQFIIIPFPSSEKLEPLANYLNTTYSRNYLIFNVSEYTYNPKQFQNQVVGYSFPGYPCLPLEAAFTLSKEIESWLKSDPKNVAVVHCQSTKVNNEVKIY